MVDEPSDLNALEQQLRSLQPLATRVNRDRLMFEAGRASSPTSRARAGWAWPATTGLLLLALVVQSVRLTQQPQSLPKPTAVREASSDERSAPAPRVTNERPQQAATNASTLVQAGNQRHDAWLFRPQSATVTVDSPWFFSTRRVLTQLGVDGLPFGGGAVDSMEGARSYMQWREVLDLNPEIPAALKLNLSPEETSNQGTT